MRKKVTDLDTGEEFSLHYTDALIKDIQDFYKAGCDHEHQEIRRSTMRDGRTEIRNQCLECGELIGSAIAKKNAPSELSDVDLVLQEKYETSRNTEMNQLEQKHVRQQREQNASFEEEYARYLNTIEWKEKRRKVISRAGGLCEGCREKPADVVHHLTYEHVFDELLFELVALCKECHDRCHPEHTSRSEPTLEDVELPCCGCRWGGMIENGKEWCSILNMPATKAISDNDLCSKVSEPLK